MPLKSSVTIDEVISLLNEMLEKDPQCTQELFNHRLICNNKIADHPTIQVRKYKEDPEPLVGILGVLNGLFGINENNGMGALMVDVDANNPKNINKFLHNLNSYDD